MYINAILSHLGGWKQLQTDYLSEFNDIQDAISGIDLGQLESRQKRSRVYSIRAVNDELHRCLVNLHWNSDIKIYFGEELKDHFSRIDFMKNGLGLEISLGRYAFAESDLFVKFPLFARAAGLQMGIVFVPMKTLAHSLSIVTGTFEMLSTRIATLEPLPLRYPFVLIGVSDNPSHSVLQIELTSELDQFLTAEIGISLGEMKLLGESPTYDFKERLPENRKTAQEICAFANGDTGGVILIGVNDAGDLVGIDRTELDETQLTISNIIRDTCAPTPRYEMKTFDVQGNLTRCILAIRVFSLPRKPCMTRDMVYIRSGSSARPATPAEIRRLVLGSAD